MIAYFRGAHRAGFVARRNWESAETMLAADLPNACVVRNPVNLIDLTPVPWPAASEPRLACVARLDADHKGQDILFAILAQEPWKSRPWTLRLYGDGRHRSFLIDLATISRRQRPGRVPRPCRRHPYHLGGESFAAHALALRGDTARPGRGDAVRSSIGRHRHRRQR